MDAAASFAGVNEVLNSFYLLSKLKLNEEKTEFFASAGLTREAIIGKPKISRDTTMLNFK